MNRKNTTLARGIDWPVVYLFFALALVGVLSIFAVEHREGESVLKTLFHFSKTYAQQVKWLSICAIIAIVILQVDSKFFTATANLLYVAGIVLLLVVLVAGKDIKGSHSWLVIGGFQFQPAELCKLFTALALAKYLSGLETNFRRLKSQVIAIAIALVPAFITIFQNETGLALVYFCFFIPMYREGLPGEVLVVAFSLVILVISALLVNKDLLFIILSGLALVVLYLGRTAMSRHRGRILLVVLIWGFCSSFVMFAVPFAFKHILKPYQVTRINVMLGKEINPQAGYNVMQSKIAIGSGGFLGKGYLKGTQTRFDFVPEQSTDFIFCTIGEEFGFIGCLILLVIYMALLMRIILIAERQRSVFTRVYAYGVASIIFFHMAINIGMAVGLAPVIGIPLPLISYGGSSLMTFTALIFILLRLDADRQMVLR
ncbi:MAG TPA: rod shape-determining protein RodA [Chitinophagaceae bacterium]|nr:rod shape-determining protein RodA [Chitinophagaceae bacterium]